MKISREEIYSKIWSAGIFAAAKEYGIDRKQLLDVCATNDIPIPPNSYWHIQRLGKVVPVKIPLPPAKGNPLIEFPERISTDVTQPPSRKNMTRKNPCIQADKKKTEAGLIKKFATKGNEPLILKAGTLPVNEDAIERNKEKVRNKALQRVRNNSLRLNLNGGMNDWTEKIETAILAFPISKLLRPKKAIILDSIEYYSNYFKPWDQRDSSHYYINSKKDPLSLSVSKELLRPALAIYDSIIDIADALGLSVTIEREGTMVTIGDYKTEITIREINRQINVREQGSNYSRRTLEGTGKFKLCIGPNYHRKEYRETDLIGIQDKLLPFFKGLMTCYLDELEWREELKRRELQRQREEEKRRLEELERQRIAELRLIELKKVEETIVRAYKCQVYHSLQSLAEELVKRGNNDDVSEITRIASMLDPVSPQYGDLLEERDIDSLILKLMKKEN